MDVAVIYVAIPNTSLPNNSYEIRFLSCKSKQYGIPWTSSNYTYNGYISITGYTYNFKLYSLNVANNSIVQQRWAESDMSTGNSWLHSDTSSVNESSYDAYQYTDVLVWPYDKTVYKSQKTIYVFSDYEYNPFGTWIDHTGNLVGGTTKREFHNKSTSVCVADTINAGCSSSSYGTRIVELCSYGTKNTNVPSTMGVGFYPMNTNYPTGNLLTYGIAIGSHIIDFYENSGNHAVYAYGGSSTNVERRTFAIHNVSASSTDYNYKAGYVGNGNSSGGFTHGVYGLSDTASFDSWCSMTGGDGVRYYAITSRSNSVLAKQAISVATGKTYAFQFNTFTEVNYDGVVLSTQSNLTASQINFSNAGLARCSGINAEASYTYTATSNRMLYLYFKTDSRNLGDVIDEDSQGHQTYSGYTYCDVKVTEGTPGQIVVNLDDNGGSGGEGYLNIEYGATVNGVTVPTRSGPGGSYTFMGYYNTSAITGGTMYIDSSGNSTRPIDFDGTDLYARWKNTIYYTPTTADIFCTSDCAATSSTGGTSVSGTCASSSWTCASGGTLNWGRLDSSGWTVSNNGITLSTPSTNLSAGSYSGIAVVQLSSPPGSNYIASIMVYQISANLIATTLTYGNVSTPTLTQENDIPPSAFTLYISGGSYVTDYFTASSSSQTIICNNGTSRQGNITYTYSFNSGDSISFSSLENNITSRTQVNIYSTYGKRLTVTANGEGDKRTSTYTNYMWRSANQLLSQHYKDQQCTQIGENYVYGYPSVTITNNLTAAGGTFYVTCSVTNSTSWYRKYTSGYVEPYTATGTTASGWWRITSQKFGDDESDENAIDISRFSEPSSGASWSSELGAYVYPSGSSYTGSHSSMTTNVGVDVVYVTAYNMDDTDIHTTKKAYVINELLPQHYIDSNCTQTGDGVWTYGTPGSISVGSNLTAGDSHDSVVIGTFYNTYTYYQKYTSGSVRTNNGSSRGTAKWRISTQYYTRPTGTDHYSMTRFSHPSSGGSNLSGIGMVYDVGAYLYHTTMCDEEGHDNVEIIAYNIADTSKTNTQTFTVTNELLEPHYKDSACTQPGDGDWVFATPYITSSSSAGNAAGGSGNIYVGSGYDHYDYYQKYTSGYSKSFTKYSQLIGRWKIESQTFIPASGSSSTISRFSPPSSGGSKLSGVGTVYNSGAKVTHTTMSTNEGTDRLVVTVYNIYDISKNSSYTIDITNSLGTQKYKNTSGTTGYNLTYENPTVSIGSGMTLKGGSSTITSTVTNSTSWYYKYTSGSYTTLQTGTEAGTAKWRITNGYNVFHLGGEYTESTITVNGSSVKVYNSGAKIYHNNMTTYARTDTVVITAYNVGNTSKTATAQVSFTNNLESISTSVIKNPINVNEQTGLEVKATYTTGSKKVVSSDATYSGYDTSIISVSPNSYVAGLWIDDFDETDLETWTEDAGYQDPYDLMSDYANSPASMSSNYFEYRGTYEYNGHTYYIWKCVSYVDSSSPKYVLTNTKNYGDLYYDSVQYDLYENGGYDKAFEQSSTIVTFLTEDMGTYEEPNYVILKVIAAP